MNCKFSHRNLTNYHLLVRYFIIKHRGMLFYLIVQTTYLLYWMLAKQKCKHHYRVMNLCMHWLKHLCSAAYRPQNVQTLGNELNKLNLNLKSEKISLRFATKWNLKRILDAGLYGKLQFKTYEQTLSLPF